MKPKGFVKISVSKQTDAELQIVKKQLSTLHPELQQPISYNTLICWMCRAMKRQKFP